MVKNEKKRPVRVRKLQDRLKINKITEIGNLEEINNFIVSSKRPHEKIRIRKDVKSIKKPLNTTVTIFNTI